MVRQAATRPGGRMAATCLRESVAWFPVADLAEVGVVEFFVAVGTSSRVLRRRTAVSAVVLAGQPHHADAAMHPWHLMRLDGPAPTASGSNPSRHPASANCRFPGEVRPAGSPFGDPRRWGCTIEVHLGKARFSSLPGSMPASRQRAMERTQPGVVKSPGWMRRRPER